MTSSFYRNCAGILFVYDVTVPDSFTEIASFLQEANRFNERGFKFLIASKCDLDAQVDATMAREFAENESMDGFFETSSKTGAGVKDTIAQLVTTLKKREESKAGDRTSGSAPAATLVRVEASSGGGTQQKKCFI